MCSRRLHARDIERWRDFVSSAHGEDSTHASEDDINLEGRVNGVVSRLAKIICEQQDLSMRDVTFLSDSTTALWWIHGGSRNFRPFVASKFCPILLLLSK